MSLDSANFLLKGSFEWRERGQYVFNNQSNTPVIIIVRSGAVPPIFTKESFCDRLCCVEWAGYCPVGEITKERIAATLLKAAIDQLKLQEWGERGQYVFNNRSNTPVIIIVRSGAVPPIFTEESFCYRLCCVEWAGYCPVGEITKERIAATLLKVAIDQLKLQAEGDRSLFALTLSRYDTFVRLSNVLRENKGHAAEPDSRRFPPKV